MKWFVIASLMITYLMGCASNHPESPSTKVINFSAESKHLNNLFKSKMIKLKLKFEDPVTGIFENATFEHIVVQTISEYKYIPLNQVVSIKVHENQGNLKKFTFISGSAGALVGGIVGNSSNQAGKKNGSDLSKSLSNMKGPVLGSSVGGFVGIAIANITSRLLIQSQPIEYIASNRIKKNFFETVKFDADELIRNWEEKGVELPIKRSSLRKLLAHSELMILNDQIGERIDADENKRYRFFSPKLDFSEVYIFRLNFPRKNKSRYLAFFILPSYSIKIRVLKPAVLLKMKSRLN